MKFGIIDLTQDEKDTMSSVELQARMSRHLHEVQTLSNEAMLHGIDMDQALLRATLAQAHATAAQAIAIHLGAGDLEVAITKLGLVGES